MGICKILLENYNTLEKVTELISYGGISSLYPEIGKKHNFDKSGPDENGPDENGSKWCTFYHRDRGDTFQSANCKSKTEIVKTYDWSEFHYVWCDTHWIVNTCDGGFDWLPLTKELIELANNLAD